jgi:2-haloacid dehalogenase
LTRSGNRVELRGRALLAGEAAGTALVLQEPLSLWGGLDPRSGRLCDHHHPQLGATTAGRVLVMPSGRGSSSSSSVLAEAVRLGTAPAAILLAEPDEILVLGALVAEYLYGRACPILVLPEAAHATIAPGDQVVVRGHRVALTRPRDPDGEEKEKAMTDRSTATTGGRAALDLGEFSALTFDCYGTLIDWETGILAALRPWVAAHRVEAGDEELLAAFGRAESRREADDPTAPYPRILAGVLEDLAAELGTTVTPKEAAAFGDSVKDWPAFPDSADALAYLRRHYRLVIVSNVDRASFRHSNAKLGVTFDAVVTAEDAGAYKPAPNHFRVALARLAALGVPKDRVLHVAQSLFHDHVPAKELGLRTMWVNRRASRPGGGGPSGSGATPLPPVPVTPDGEVPTMAALADLHRRQLAR